MRGAGYGEATEITEESSQATSRVMRPGPRGGGPAVRADRRQARPATARSACGRRRQHGAARANERQRVDDIGHANSSRHWSSRHGARRARSRARTSGEERLPLERDFYTDDTASSNLQQRNAQLPEEFGSRWDLIVASLGLTRVRLVNPFDPCNPCLNSPHLCARHWPLVSHSLSVFSASSQSPAARNPRAPRCGWSRIATPRRACWGKRSPATSHGSASPRLVTPSAIASADPGPSRTRSTGPLPR